MDNYLFEVTEAPLPRKRIEDDLLVRHRQLKRKIEALKVRRMKEETKHNQPVPTINPNSRRIASSSEKSISKSESRIRRTYEILATSRFVPKKASICLESLDTSVAASKHTYSKFAPNITKPPIATLITFPSLERVHKQSPDTFPEDILKRNELLNTLRTETVTRGFITEPQEPPMLLTIHERSQKWLRRKEEKLKDMKQKIEDRALDGCTFKPKVKKSFFISRTQRSPISDCSYLEMYERRMRVRESKGWRSERTVSQETKPATTIHSTRSPSSVKGVASPRYSSLCPVSLSLGQLSGFNRVIKKYKVED